MTTKYPVLFSPVKIGKLEVKNRFFMSSMGGNDEIDLRHGFGDKMKKYYLERAKGGMGMLATGTITIREHGERYIADEQFLLEENDKAFFKMSSEDWIKDIHAYGAKILAQLSIGTNPCQFPGTFSPKIGCDQITREQIKYFVRRYADAAKLCKDAGFDMVEVHSIHTGYLLDQFSTASTNNRTDEYGGCIENRARFAIECLDAIKEACGQDYPVSLKIGGISEIYDMHTDGTIKVFRREIGETVELCRLFSKAGFDAFSVDGCRNNSVYTPNTTNLDYWKMIKDAVDVPVIAAGSLADAELNTRMIESGYCDAIGMGRQTICDPHYANKLKANRFDDIRHCLKCNGGCIRNSLYGYPVTCVANPRAGLDADIYLHQAETRKKVFVVGGGLGGMEAAITASKRGHDVSLFEKTGELGGLFLAASAFDFKDVDKQLIEYYRHQLAKSTVNLFMNTEVTPEFIEANSPDVVIVATGSSEIRIPVPGANGGNVVTVAQASRKQVAIGERVVIVGGGLSGCELGAQLVSEGKKVTVVELLPKLMSTIRRPVAMSINPLIARLTDGDADIRCLTALKEIRPASVIVERDGEQTEIPADTVVMAAGFRKNDALFRALGDYAGEVYAIGDCRNVDDIYNAIWGGFNLGKGI